MSEDVSGEKAPSELRTVAENVAIMGLVVGLAVLTGENLGKSGEAFAGAMIVFSGIFLKAKSDLEVYQRSTREAESNREFLSKVATAIKSLKKSSDVPESVGVETTATALSGD